MPDGNTNLGDEVTLDNRRPSEYSITDNGYHFHKGSLYAQPRPMEASTASTRLTLDGAP
jgi:hypothetical protein